MIWATLYSIRDDAGLEATGLRAVFEGMTDLGGSAPLYALDDADEPAPLWALDETDTPAPLWARQ